MEIVKKASKLTETRVAKWTIADFFTHVNNKTYYLDSENFELDGLSTKFRLRVYINIGLPFVC